MFASTVPRLAKMLGVSEGLIWLCTVLAVIAIVVAGASSGGPLAVAMLLCSAEVRAASSQALRTDPHGKVDRRGFDGMRILWGMRVTPPQASFAIPDPRLRAKPRLIT